MGELQKLPNIGPALEAQLHGVGIETPQQLREAGSRDAWLRIRQEDPSACYSRLCGLEGAVRGIRWHGLDPAVKQDLLAFYRSHRPG